MTNRPTPTSPLVGDLPAGGAQLSLEWAAATAAFRVIDKALAVTLGAALVGHAAAIPAWLNTTEVTVCAAQGALLLGASALKGHSKRSLGRFSGGPSFRPGELAPGELPQSSRRS